MNSDHENSGAVIGLGLAAISGTIVGLILGWLARALLCAF